jgi:hypothetical protein
MPDTTSARRVRRAVPVLALAAAVATPLALAAPAGLAPGNVTTVANGGLNQPRAVLADGDGFLIADRMNHRVVRIDASGGETTVAGVGDSGFGGDGGEATRARLREPTDLARMPDGGYLIADQLNQRVRRVSPTGTISTVAGDGMVGTDCSEGPAVATSLGRPRGVAVLPGGAFLIADELSNCIRKVEDGFITTVAGNGAPGSYGDGGDARLAGINTPLSVAIAADGGILIAERDGNRIRKVAPNGIITTVAGNGAPGLTGDGGTATSAQINSPRDVAPTADGGFYLTDSLNRRIRRVAPDGTITTVAGTAGVPELAGDGGAALDAGFGELYGLDLIGADLYASESLTNRVRVVAAPLPRVAAIAPSRAKTATVARSLTVAGSGFPVGATVLWNGRPIRTTRASSTRLTARIPAGLLRTPRRVAVAVRAARAGGDVSAALPFRIVRGRPPVRLGVPRLRAVSEPVVGGRLKLKATSSLPGRGVHLLLQQRVGPRWVTLKRTTLRTRVRGLGLSTPRAQRIILRIRLQSGSRARVSRPVVVDVLPPEPLPPEEGVEGVEGGESGESGEETTETTDGR